MECSWCDRPATFFLVSDRDSHNSIDHACAEHAAQWGHLYRRRVPIPVAGPGRDVVDLRLPHGEEAPQEAEVDVRGDTVPAARAPQDESSPEPAKG